MMHYNQKEIDRLLGIPQRSDSEQTKLFSATLKRAIGRVCILLTRRKIIKAKSSQNGAEY